MDVNSLTKISLVWELHCEGVPKLHLANQLGISRATIYRWINGIHQFNGELESFIDDYLIAKKGERTKRKIDPLVKAYVWKIREEHRDCCGQKIQYHLQREKSIHLGVTTIYKILTEKYQLRTKWKKNKARGPVLRASKAREVIQMDTVDFGEVFAFTGVDIYSKDVDVVLRPSLTSRDGLVFLETSMGRRFGGYSKLTQTDGGPEFKDEFKSNVHRFTSRHRVARPYKKNEQSYIESFNRSLRKECLGWGKYGVGDIRNLTKEVEQYLIYYHEVRPHLSLNMQTPLDFSRLSHI